MELAKQLIDLADGNCIKLDSFDPHRKEAERIRSRFRWSTLKLLVELLKANRWRSARREGPLGGGDEPVLVELSQVVAERVRQMALGELAGPGAELRSSWPQRSPGCCGPSSSRWPPPPHRLPLAGRARLRAV